MKHSQFSQKMRLAFLTSMVFLTSGSAFAQGDGKAFLDAMDQEVGSLGTSIISLLTKALGIGALITFVIVIVKTVRPLRSLPGGSLDSPLVLSV